MISIDKSINRCSSTRSLLVMVPADTGFRKQQDWLL